MFVLYYGLLDLVLCQQVEDGLCVGVLCCVVVIFSFDFGVDFFEVEQVLQLGSLKGVVCLCQCVGCVCYCLGVSGFILCVFSYVLELVEYVVVCCVLVGNVVEVCRLLMLLLDVLVQYVVSCVLVGGFDSVDLLVQVWCIYVFVLFGDDQWQVVFIFIVQGG